MTDELEKRELKNKITQREWHQKLDERKFAVRERESLERVLTHKIEMRVGEIFDSSKARIDLI